MSPAAAPETPTADDTRTHSPFACPSCRAPLDAETMSTFCPSCGAQFNLAPEDAPFRDLTVAQDKSTGPSVISRLIDRATKPAQQEIFRSQLVSFLYERGWRENFRVAGFPGADAEAAMAQQFFEPARGGRLLDMSCGSGLMTRRFVKSKLYNEVIACDFSESMLREVDRRRRAESLPAFPLVRGDVSRLPFATASMDAVHAGAALHCWPRVQDGVREIHRVLKPGGLFFATTFLWAIAGGTRLEARSVPYRFFDQVELEWIMKGAGFSEVGVDRIQRCAVIRCRK